MNPTVEPPAILNTKCLPIYVKSLSIKQRGTLPTVRGGAQCLTYLHHAQVPVNNVLVMG